MPQLRVLEDFMQVDFLQRLKVDRGKGWDGRGGMMVVMMLLGSQRHLQGV